ncbi:MAG: hypothetical protein NZ611_02660, partial [Bacteroidia bacterium]|nr:hypothetical protein [Bacteroidia bacterium]
MNPPFTRSSIDNLLFGSVPISHRPKLSVSLQKLLDQRDLKASVQAGLAAVFLAQADQYLEREGR